MMRELVNEKREEQAEVEVDEKADIDSVDSHICACSSSMLMRFSHAHDVHYAHGVNDRGQRFAMENGVDPERRKRLT
jgi:hypothetical protein